MPGQVYHIAADAAGWLYPLFGLGGIAVLILGGLLKWRPLIALGPAIAAFGAIPEHDASLLAGICAAAAGFWFLASPGKKKGPETRGPKN